ncbi:MAG: hypothetical protein LBT42_05240 [Tannerella sp.]|nr:hypothetical protein [Tannerella sp.]
MKKRLCRSGIDVFCSVISTEAVRGIIDNGIVTSTSCRPKQQGSAAETPLDEWIYFLKTTEIPETFTAPGLPEAREKLACDSLAPEEKRITSDTWIQSTLREMQCMQPK